MQASDSKHVARQRAQLAEATRLRANLGASADTRTGSNLLTHRVQRVTVREITQHSADIIKLAGWTSR